MADTTHKIEAQTQAIKNLTGGVTFLTKAWKQYASAIETMTEAQTDLQDAAYRGTQGFTAMAESLDASSRAINEYAQVYSELARAVPAMGQNLSRVTDAMGWLGETFAIAAQKQRILAGEMGYWDSFSSFTRRLESDMRGMAGSFGLGVDASRDLAESFVGVQEAVATEDYGFISGDELTSFRDQMAAANLEVGYMTESVTVGGKQMNFLGAGILQAGYLGLEASSYMNLLGDAIMKQGLGAEEAMESIAGYAIVARETGLSVDTISKSMNEAANQFSMLGMSADFGRPLILGFSDSLDNMGLGMENSIALTKTLTDSLGKLGMEYDKAYLLQQRGGMDFGAGNGALGAGIGIQAAMLQAEGDPQAQAELGSTLANSLRSTLESFGGGNIVTVSEAAENPQLQNQFYVQQQLLERQFGMDEKSSIRTLEMLAELEEANSRGDQDLARELERQIASETEGRDETLDELKKLNTYAAAQLAATLMDNRDVNMQGRRVSGNLRGQGERESRDFNSDIAVGWNNLFGGANGGNVAEIQRLVDERMRRMRRPGDDTVMDGVTGTYGPGSQTRTGETYRNVTGGFMGTAPVTALESSQQHMIRYGDMLVQSIDANNTNLTQIQTLLVEFGREMAAEMRRLGASMLGGVGP